MVDTLAALIIPGLVTPLGVFLMRQFFVSLPREVEEAARIDGCSRLGVLLHVAIPLARPALATLAALTFLISWNDLLWPVIAINSEETFTLPLGLTTFQGQHTQDWAAVMAGNVITALPVRGRLPACAAHVHRVPHLERGEGLIGVAAIRIERVTKVYDDRVTAVDDVSLEVSRRRIHGPGRAVRLWQVDAAAGDRRARAGHGGRVLIGDDDVTGLDPADRDIAMVFQSYALYPHKTVRENLAFGLRRRRVGSDEITRAGRRDG